MGRAGFGRDKLIVLPIHQLKPRQHGLPCRGHTLSLTTAPENVLDQVRRAGVNVVVVREEGDSISSAA
jgi:hypothetical protein